MPLPLLPPHNENKASLTPRLASSSTQLKVNREKSAWKQISNEFTPLFAPSSRLEQICRKHRSCPPPSGQAFLNRKEPQRVRSGCNPRAPYVGPLPSRPVTLWNALERFGTLTTHFNYHSHSTQLPLRRWRPIVSFRPRLRHQSECFCRTVEWLSVSFF